jgi:hypothetical protein
MSHQQDDERTPLLPNGDPEGHANTELLHLSADDPENPRAWRRARKLANVAVIASMAILSPLASSMVDELVIINPEAVQLIAP